MAKSAESKKAAGASSSTTKPTAAAAAASSSSPWLSPMSVAALVLLLAVLMQVATIPSVTGPPNARKPFSTFTQFYPFYTSEHSDKVNRQCHFAGTSLVILLFALHPRSLPSILLAGAVGLLLCPMLIGLSHGFVEFAAVLAVFLGVHKLSTGKLGVAVLIPLIGYGAAWYGHFWHEHNRPATFVYPTFSLLGDFWMFARIVTGVEQF